jgi:2',3'-cyclic-nucleotide 2'-phosphodiesterase (5'-nucleotidase family)
MRRRFLLGLLALGVTALAVAQPTSKPLTILHFNDLHAQLEPRPDGTGGVAYLAAAIRREKAGCGWCLVLSAGDFVQGSPVSTIFQGVPVIEIANLLGIDAATLGNHEYDYGWRKVAEYQRVARFPFVVANLVDASDKTAAPPYRVLTAGGLRVAVIGAMTMDFAGLGMPDRLGDWHTTPVVETVNRYARQLRDRSDLVVLLGHLNPQEEDAVLRDIPEVAVTIGGHVHTGVAIPKNRDGREMVRVKSSSGELGRLDLRVNPAEKKVVSSKWTLIPVGTAAVKPAADVAKAVARWEAKVTKMMDVPIAESRRVWKRPDLKALFERAIAEETGSDFGFCNRGGIRAELPQGTILVRHVWAAFPFDNRVVKGRFRGSELPATVTAGRAIEPDRIYTLVTSDFTAANQSQPSELNATGMKFPETGPLQRDLLVEWIKKKKILE